MTGASVKTLHDGVRLVLPPAAGQHRPQFVEDFARELDQAARKIAAGTWEMPVEEAEAG